MPRHPLILDGSLTPLAGHQNCACTVYLVFKEPASALHQTHHKFRRLGNLTSLPFAPSRVNNFFRCVRALNSHVNRGFNRGRTYRKGPAWGAEHTKKFAPSFFRSKSSGRQGPGHAQSDHYTIRPGRCQPRRVRAAELTAAARPDARARTRIRDPAAPPQPRAPAPAPARAWRAARPPAPCSA